MNGLCFRIGPFHFRLHSDLSEFTELIRRMYADYAWSVSEFADFHIDLVRHAHWLRPWQPQVQFFVGDKAPFQPFPRDTALPFLEWGLNWCVATHAHHYLMLHAGVIEKNNQTLILPAWPGSGKSTLTAALCQRGWRLLSDEFGLVRPQDGLLAPFPRLIPLKNESIAVFRDFAPNAVMGPEYPKTRKGTVCHLRPPTDSIERDQELAKPRWIVFPEYRKGVAMNLCPIEKTQAFVMLSGHSFNYDLIGLRGFRALANLIDTCDCYTFEYGGDLEQAVVQLNTLADDLI
ncbi:MAG: HprK-related kinase A [Candidatus Competibacteraceae bacterium]|nr:HprK-related kinase A [Candidatus Competibacteraceae bacterium]